MRKILILSFLTVLAFNTYAQSAGDTIKVQSFIHSSTTRDTVVNFPDIPGVTYEKILMLYNIRCTDGLVSTGTNTNLGCGEWDYSCNTYVTDSSIVDSSIAFQNSHMISNFSGTEFPYTTQATKNYYRYIQQNTSAASIVSETQSTVGTVGTSLNHVIPTEQNSSKSQYLYTQAELSAAGMVTGDLNGISLNALSAGTANFLRIRIKHTNLTALDAASVDTSGFTECYFANTAFVTGLNRLQFYTPFNWDGTSNIIIEFSFTNTIPSSALIIDGEMTNGNYGLYAKNGYSINTSGAGTVSIPNTIFGLKDEITVSFWAKGDEDLFSNSNNNTAISAFDSLYNIQLRVLAPTYLKKLNFICGNNGSANDVIYKSGDISYFEGKWNHWAFTKNANTGSMIAYFNGTAWKTGSGKTKQYQLDSIIFGSDFNSLATNPYAGNLDELRIWDTALSATDIQDWMYKSIDNTHPNYAHLKSYYKLDEGSGNSTDDSSINTLTGTFLNTPDWRNERGIDLNRFFIETMERPVVTFLQGTYNLSLVNDTIFDSIANSSHYVKEYEIQPKYGTNRNDSIVVIHNYNYWPATFNYIYDATTGALLDSIPVIAEDTVQITSLQYYKRYAGRLELMSFVTPYGINLDLGMEGKTWTFDVTDYESILKGSKRINVVYGKWQEDMDISFLYIVGTPPHDVIDFRQIWRVPEGTKKYQDILDDKCFEPRTMYVDPAADHVKLRSVITGHGQEGEFIPRNHYLDIDGGTHEFVWQEWTECAENPIYPQGGTWIYDRAGWCPGMPSDPSIFDATPYVTPGTNFVIDYGMYTASGTSTYIINHQMTTYGAPNFNLDASVVTITAPTNQVEYLRTNSICANPKIIIKNTGSTALTSLTIEYWVNNASTKETYTWTGNLDFLEEEEISLPSPSTLWDAVTPTDNFFHVEIASPNGSSDEYMYNNVYSTSFSLPTVMPSDSYFYFKTNSKPQESKYYLYDDAGNVLFSRTSMTANTVYRDTFNLGIGCYTLEVIDTDDDGINFWANSDGNGAMYFRQINGSVIQILEPDFGGSFIFNFTVDFPLTYEELYPENDIKVYPNPATNHFIVEYDFIEEAEVSIFNSMGQEVFMDYNIDNGRMKFNIGNTPLGLYFVSVNTGGKIITKKIIIE